MLIRNKLLPALLVSLLVVSGCASFKPLEQGLESMVGKDASMLTDVLGAPDEVKPVGEGVAYRWTQAGVQGTVAQASRYTGGNGTDRNTDGIVAPVGIDHFCDIRAMIDSYNKITHWNYDGSVVGCSNQIVKMIEYNDRVSND